MNIYVINYKNEERKNRMLDRYQKLCLNDFFKEMIFTKEVESNDSRLQRENVKEPRIWSIMLQHLDAVRSFVEDTEDEYCIICEDDVHISKQLKRKMPGILKVFDSLDLDILMLGYLLPFKIEENNGYFNKIAEHQGLTYRKFPNDTWGTQGYLISRKYGKYLLETFTVEYALSGVCPYNPDWIITKNGNRMLVNPMLILEEGVNLSDNDSQIDFHRRCHKCHMSDEYV